MNHSAFFSQLEIFKSYFYYHPWSSVEVRPEGVVKNGAKNPLKFFGRIWKKLFTNF